MSRPKRAQRIPTAAEHIIFWALLGVAFIAWGALRLAGTMHGSGILSVLLIACGLGFIHAGVRIFREVRRRRMG